MPHDLERNPATLPPRELPVQRARFNDEARETLIKEGYCIYTITGKPQETLDADRPLWLKPHPDYDVFEALESHSSEVAINPNCLFLEGSNNKTFKQQREMVKTFSNELLKKIPEVQAIIGEAADYVKLVYAHLDETDKYLFGKDDHYYYTRTLAKDNEPTPAIVGSLISADKGLSVLYCDPNESRHDLWVAPLVVPAQIR